MIPYLDIIKIGNGQYTSMGAHIFLLIPLEQNILDSSNYTEFEVALHKE